MEIPEETRLFVLPAHQEAELVFAVKSHRGPWLGRSVSVSVNV